MFENLDDPWSFDEPLAEVTSVRKRGRALQLRRRVATAGGTAMAAVVLFGSASFAGLGANGPGPSVAARGTQQTHNTVVDTSDTTAATRPEPAPTDTSIAPGTEPETDGETPGGDGTGSTGGGNQTGGPEQPGTEPGETPAPDPQPAPAPSPTQIVRASAKDAYVTGQRNQTYGTGVSAQVSHSATTLLGFDLSGVDTAGVTKATLRLTVCSSGGLCPDGVTGWPADGSGYLSVMRLNDGFGWWQQDSVTGNCPADTDPGPGIDCTPAQSWSLSNADSNDDSIDVARSGSITNALADTTTIEIDVTAFVRSGIRPVDASILSFVVRRSQGAGQIAFYSTEGAAARANAALAPQLVLTQG